MKKVFLTVFFVTSVVVAQKIDRKAIYNHSQEVEFSIYTLNKKRSIDRGSGYYRNIVVADKGDRFIAIIFDFKNNSSTDQVIDFEKIFLKDDKGGLHSIDFVAMMMKLGTRTDKLQQKIKAGKSRKIAVEFRPPFAKEELIDELVIGDQIIHLKYEE